MTLAEQLAAVAKRARAARNGDHYSAGEDALTTLWDARGAVMDRDDERARELIQLATEQLDAAGAP